jgi:hypothetical protein
LILRTNFVPGVPGVPRSDFHVHLSEIEIIGDLLSGAPAVIHARIIVLFGSLIPNPLSGLKIFCTAQRPALVILYVSNPTDTTHD